MAPIRFHVQDSTGRPIAGAHLDAVSSNGDWHAVTDATGDFTANLSPGHYDIAVSATGYVSRVIPADLADPGSVFVGLDSAGTGPIPSVFKVAGPNFLDPVTNQRISYCLCDCFPAYRFWLDGRMADLEALAGESLSLGFQGWRIFGMGAISQNFVMDLWPQNEPKFYSEQRPFAQWMASKGLIGLWTVNVDAQIVMPDHGRRIANFQQTVEHFRNGNQLISYGNEAPKNGFDPNEAPNPGPGIVWSRGSGLSDQATPANGATAAEFHQRRDIPKTFDDSVASSTYLQYTQGYGMLWMDEPLGAAETPTPGKRSSDPFVFWQLARDYATFWALGCFHSDAGQRGQLLGPTQRACAEAWVRGMRMGL